ncbi:4260_t:CDS:2, partial [Gigaspora rosea]
ATMIKHSTESSQKHYHDGLAAFRKKEFEKAQAYFTKAIVLEPNNIQLYDSRAATREKLGQLTSALQDAEIILNLEKTSAKGYLRAGKLYRLLGQNEMALDIYNKGIKEVKQNDQLLSTLHKLAKEMQEKSQKSTVIKSTKTCDITVMFPTELVHWIFGCLPFTSLCKASIVSKRWRNLIINSRFLWRNLDFTINRPSKAVVTDQVVSTYVNRGKLQIQKFICHNAGYLSDKTLKIFRAVPCYHLKTFELSFNTSITETAFVIFIRTIGTELKIINFSNTYISDKVVKTILMHCPQLETLKISSCVKVTIQAFDLGDRQCKALRVQDIDLNGCQGINKAVVPFITILFPNITRLNIHGISGLTTRTLADLVHFPNLEFISMFGNMNEDGLDIENAFITFTSACPLIRQFVLEECPDLTDNCVRFLVMSCINLEELTLNGSYKLTDETTQHIGTYCQQLKVLRIGKSPGITDSGINEMLNLGFGSLLEVIELKQNNITDNSLKKLADCCDKLKEVNVNWCHNITGSGVAYLVKKCGKSMQYLSMVECFNVAPDAVDLARKILGQHGGMVNYLFRTSR